MLDAVMLQWKIIKYSFNLSPSLHHLLSISFLSCLHFSPQPFIHPPSHFHFIPFLSSSFSQPFVQPPSSSIHFIPFLSLSFSPTSITFPFNLFPVFLFLPAFHPSLTTFSFHPFLSSSFSLAFHQAFITYPFHFFSISLFLPNLFLPSTPSVRVFDSTKQR